MSRKRTSAKVNGVQMRLEPLDDRVLPDAKVDLDVSGATAAVQPANTNAKPDAYLSKDHHHQDFDSALSGAAMTRIWGHLLKDSAKHPADYQAMLQVVETDALRVLAHEFVILEGGSANGSIVNRVVESAGRRENAHVAELENAEEISNAIVETLRVRESEGEKVPASASESVDAAGLALVRATTESKPAPANPHHSSAELDAAYASAAPESQSAGTARVEGEHAVWLLASGHAESPLVQMPVAKDLLIVPLAYLTSAPIGASEKAVAPPADPLVVSVADVEEAAPTPQPQAEETPVFVSQAADLIARCTPFDAATVNENIERFLTSLRQTRLPQSAGYHVWKIAAIATTGAVSMLSAEFIRRKGLLQRVPVIRNVRQRLKRTKTA
ncbi:MAG TPA: hypothetical protein VKS79_11310 [Gemmataceae bacterium]|nr:hypothetical protein [Gemmataceae bacterium]